MDSTLWLAIAAVSAVTAVILARRKNRSTVIWPMVSFVFPFALLPLFALPPLPEKNTQELDRKFHGATASVLVLVVGVALIRYGSLHPCDMYAYEVAKGLASEGIEPGPQDEWDATYRFLFSPGECLTHLVQAIF